MWPGRLIVLPHYLDERFIRDMEYFLSENCDMDEDQQETMVELMKPYTQVRYGGCLEKEIEESYAPR